MAVAVCRKAIVIKTAYCSPVWRAVRHKMAPQDQRLGVLSELALSGYRAELLLGPA